MLLIVKFSLQSVAPHSIIRRIIHYSTRLCRRIAFLEPQYRSPNLLSHQLLFIKRVWIPHLTEWGWRRGLRRTFPYLLARVCRQAWGRERAWATFPPEQSLDLRWGESTAPCGSLPLFFFTSFLDILAI